MPDVRVDWRPDLAPDGAVETLRSSIADALAAELSCTDDSGKEIVMSGDGDFAMFMTPIAAASKTKSDLVIMVRGFAYKSRMEDIDERLKRVAATIQDGLPRKARISVLYLVVPGKCWVVS